MKVDVENLPESLELSHKIIASLQLELKEAMAYKSKYDNILEQLRLAKQQRFAPSSEKGIVQPDMFDEAGVDLPEEAQEQLSDEADSVTIWALKTGMLGHALLK